jgi:hypothetical protein
LGPGFEDIEEPTGQEVTVVSKIGRNDPCPCGSGKKYKHCCLKEEAAGKSEAMGRDRAWDTMMDKLLDFSREARFRQDLESAFDLFWNKSYTIEQSGELPPAQIMNFLDWYVHDYHTSGDGRRIVQIFLEDKTPVLTEQERSLLAADAEALLSAFEVTGVEEGQTIGLLDVFQDIEVQLAHTPSLQGIEQGQLLLGRLVNSVDYRRFSWISALIPPEVEEDFKAHVQEMFAAYQDEHYQAPWAQFLRERSYLFNHFILKLRGEVAPPRVILPFAERTQAEPRSTVLTLDSLRSREGPPVAVPGKRERKGPTTVLVPGRDS